MIPRKCPLYNTGMNQIAGSLLPTMLSDRDTHQQALLLSAQKGTIQGMKKELPKELPLPVYAVARRQASIILIRAFI